MIKTIFFFIQFYPLVLFSILLIETEYLKKIFNMFVWLLLQFFNRLLPTLLKINSNEINEMLGSDLNYNDFDGEYRNNDNNRDYNMYLLESYSIPTIYKYED